MEPLHLALIFSVVLIAVVIFFRQRSGNQKGSVDPVAEAEVYMHYGRKEQAIEVLKKHLQRNSGDERALSKLAEIQRS